MIIEPIFATPLVKLKSHTEYLELIEEYVLSLPRTKNTYNTTSKDKIVLNNDELKIRHVDKGFKNIDRFSLDSSSKKYLKLLSEI